MKKVEELKLLKDTYLQDLEDIHLFDANPKIKELRRFELEGKILSVLEAIEYLERENQSKKRTIIIFGIVIISLVIIYLIF
jgi:hypothetical protein